MKRTIGIFSIFFFGATITACGAESSLVGGRCKQGYSQKGDHCVAPDGTVEPAQIPETETPGGDRVVDTTAIGSSKAPDGPIETDPITPITIDPKLPSPVDPKPVDPIIIVNPELPIEQPEELCAEPLVRCKGECISVMQDDPQNCGACGKICRSNICQAGVCQGGTPGDVVLVGHDMQDAWAGSAHSKVLANAIGIPTTDPIRVLVWEQGALPKTVAWTKTLIKQSISGRKIDFTSASDDAMKSGALATSYDVVFIHDAAGSDPAARGASWAPSLETFTKKGGVVIALDSFQSDMPTLVKNAGLLEVDGHVHFGPTTKFVVSDPKDVVGTQLLSPYAAIGASVGFVGAAAVSPSISWVVREKTDDNSGLPTVIHRVVY